MGSEEEYYYLDSGSNMEEEEADVSDTAEEEGYDSDMAIGGADGTGKDYKILTEEDIKHLLENDISTVRGVLSVSKGVACALLCRKNWSITSVYEDWFAAADDGERKPDPTVKSAIEQVCKICYENTRPENMASAACGHPFCSVCWKTYIATAVSDGAGCLMQHCPDPDCRVAVTLDMVERLSSEAVFNKYHRYLLRSYVESNPKRKWCPAAGCDRAVELEDAGIEGVVCDCSHNFCWNCTEEHHSPVGCKLVAKWAEKNRSEAENTKWMLAYTKPCPKCRCPIEKNQGCNHMTCKSPCLFQFCWLCGGAWRGHVSCNKKEDESNRSRVMAKNLTERYMDCYERWHSNDRSRKIAMDDLDKARRKYEGQWRMQFVVEAWEQVVECRRVLKWSYVYSYYLPEEHGKTMVKCLQLTAVDELEKLHHCVEKEIVDDECFYADFKGFSEFKGKLVNSTSLTRDYFEKLVIALENDFAHG